MHCRALKQEQILSCALRECDFNHRFVWEAMGYGMMLWKGTVLSSGWRNWRKICEVIRLRAKRLVTSCFLSNETCDCSEFSRDEIWRRSCCSCFCSSEPCASRRLCITFLHQLMAPFMWKRLPGLRGWLRITYTWKPCRKGLFCYKDGRRPLKMWLAAMNVLISIVVVQHCLGMGLAGGAGEILADAKMLLFTADHVSWAEMQKCSLHFWRGRGNMNKGRALRHLL